MERNLMRAMKAHIWESCLKSAKRNQRGEMVLRFPSLMKWGILGLFLIVLGLTLATVVEKSDKLELVAFLGIITLFLGGVVSH